MNIVTYKPYKKKLEAWSSNKDEAKELNGRKLFNVEIGKKIITDSDTHEVIKEEFIYEEIFLDVIIGIFKNKSSWNTRITLGQEPRLVISYEGKLVIHNDKISAYVDEIMPVLQELDTTLEISSLINAVLNEKTGTKYSENLHLLVDSINKKCNKNYPVEFISLVLKEYLCEEERELNEMQEKLHFMSYEELLTMAGKILAGRYAGKTGSALENAFKEELLYRLIQGDLS